MRRGAIVGALFLIGVGVVLGATVFRTDIAQATGLAQTVDATIVSPLDSGKVKVHEEGTAKTSEQNTDASGNIKVHEQGTAGVRSANEEVSVTASAANNSAPGCSTDVYTVPEGKELVVQYLSARDQGAGATNADGYVGTGNLPGVALFLVFHQQAAEFTASEDVHYAVPAGTTLTLFSVLSGATSCNAVISLGGYLQPSS